MIDSHCHIGFEKTPTETQEVLDRAKEQGVGAVLTVACAFESVPDLKKMMGVYPNLYGAFGIHPESAQTFEEEAFLKVFQALPQLVAVGEIGLDYYYNSDTQHIQRQAFLKQIELADKLHKPIIIHTRDAEADTLEILETAAQNGWLKSGGVLHCFTGSYELAKRAIELGFYVSASGIITFPKAQELRDTFARLPLDRLLIETDSPYLAPVPFRGKENDPSFLPHTLEKLAEIKGVSASELDCITTKNFKKLFRIADEN